jgi:DNA-binding IclR family transcriptional regulator
MKNSSKNKFYIQSLHRAFSIVDVIAKSTSGLNLTAISGKIDLPISTIYRILQNLIEWQYIKEDENGNYFLGLELITLGNIANKNIGFKDVAKRYMKDLSEITKETIYLAILDEVNSQVIYIDKVDSKKNIQLSASIGSRNFIHTTANGRVLIMQFSDEKIKELLKTNGMPKLTNNTITDENKFLEEINKSRLLGYSIDDLENEPEVRCIAVPIYDYRKKIVASMCISGIASQITKEIIEEKYKDLIMSAAKKISNELGYRE